MDVLQAAIPILATADPDLDDESRGANLAKAGRLIAAVPAIVAGWQRLREGKEPLPPDAALSHAANFLWQLTGRQPDAELAAIWTPSWCSTPTIPLMPPPLPAVRSSPPRPICMPA